MDNSFNRKRNNFIYKSFLCAVAFLLTVTSLSISAHAETVDYAALAQKEKHFQFRVMILQTGLRDLKFLLSLQL